MFLQTQRPNRPVIASLTSANAEFNHWLKENGAVALTDTLGLGWELKTTTQILPDEINRHGARHCLDIELESFISGPILRDLGLLEADRDARLLYLLGSDRKRCFIRFPRLEAASHELLRQPASQYIRQARMAIQSFDPGEQIKAQLGPWVDGKFGMLVLANRPQELQINLEL